MAIAANEPSPEVHESVLLAAEPVSLRTRALEAAAVATRFADDVDRQARFPTEALTALRQSKLLGILIPPSLGGEGASIGDVADICYILGAGCASSALMYAMHQINVACIVRHCRRNEWQEKLQRAIAQEQLLLASSTTEGVRGGDIRSSEAALDGDTSLITLERLASVISYGENADVILTTARRSALSETSDQVLLALRKEDYSLQRTQSWDTLGMRGTCSGGFVLKAHGRREQILPDAFEIIHSRTMMPLAHLLWSAVWAGIAGGAVQRARRFVRKARGAADGKMPPGARHLTHARAALEALRGTIQSGLRRIELAGNDANQLGSIDLQVGMNLLKVQTSEQAVSIVLSAMRACGLAGYRNDGEFAMGRFLRDILSSPIMISNDRILTNTEMQALLSDPPSGLLD